MSSYPIFTAGVFRCLTALLFVAALLVSRPGLAQDQPQPPEDEQALQQQMREDFTTIMQNMQAKGIDPRQFFQQMQEGADPADIQQQLVDQGIIDKKMMTEMQTTMEKLSGMRIQDQLHATDAEWAAIEPLIQKVQAAAAAVTPTGMGGFMASRSPAAVELSKAKKALAAAIRNQGTTPEQFATALKAVRDARDKCQQELTAARNELISVLSVRQEGILASMGIIE